MNLQLLIEFIQNYLPQEASTDNCIEIAQHFDEIHLPKNDFLVEQGKISKDYFFLAEGAMRAYTYDSEGNEITTDLFTEKSIVFECSSFFTQKTSTENIQSYSSCKGFSISFDQMNYLFHSFPEFREFGRTMLISEFASHKQRTLNMITKNAEERYLELLTSKKEIFKFAQLKHIASYLGITDTSLSRIRKEISKK